MKVIDEPRKATTDLPEVQGLGTEALIKEARQRQHRRRLALLVVAIVVIAGASTAVALVTNSPAAHKVTAPSTKPRVAGPPMGRIVSLKLAGPLVVGPNGALYVVDEQRHEVLVRLPNGQFRVVAGEGKDGYSGDGGPATKAALSNVSDITFGRGGSLYIADGGRVRVVNTPGIITTIAGDGHSGTVANGTAALSAPLNSLSSIAFSPSGELYLATASQLLRLAPNDKLVTVRAVVRSGPRPGKFIPGEDASIALDASGDLDVGSDYTGWSIYKVGHNGVASYLGHARRSGGDVVVLQPGPGGIVEAESASSIVRIAGNRLVTSYLFDKVPGTAWFTLTYFAIASNGTLYADDVGTGGFQLYQQLTSVAHNHVAVLWQHRITN
jgi:hypothetical protein